MSKKLIMDKFSVLDEFAEMYIKTAFATELELTGCVHCARQNVIQRIHKAADRKSLEVSILYGDEWGEEGDPATSPDGISSHCSICTPPEKPKNKRVAKKKACEMN